MKDTLSLFPPIPRAGCCGGQSWYGSEDVLQVSVHQSVTVTSSAALGVYEEHQSSCSTEALICSSLLADVISSQA